MLLNIFPQQSRRGRSGAAGRRGQAQTPTHQTNKKASDKKLDSQISCFNRISKDLITKSNNNTL